MKKLIFFFAIIICFCAPSTSYAQNTFAPVGAEWWYGGDCYDYDYWGSFGIWWADHMQSVKDTVIAGKPARMLSATRYQKVIGSSGISIGDVDDFFIYNTDDTVFVYDKVISDFTPLYIFNVSVGDTLCLRQPNAALTTTNPEFCVIIDSIKLETYGNEQLTSYYNHTLKDSSTILHNWPSLNWGVNKYLEPGDFYENIGKYTTKIGGNWPKCGSFFPALSYLNADYYKEIAFPTGTFRCYSDTAGTDIKMISAPCDTVISRILGIAGLEQLKYQVAIFPNPSDGSFMITAQQPLKEALNIQVADLSGRVMAQLKMAKGKTGIACDLNQLASGVYLVLLDTEGQRYYKKLVISK